MNFLDYGDSLGMAVACVALCFSVLTALLLRDFVKHQDTTVVKANSHALNYILEVY